jgi:o-succinylbenzoate synthase
MSRIAGLGLNRVARTLSPPLRSARGLLRARDGLLLALRDEAGRVGRGEAAPLPGHGTEPFDACEGALRDLAEGLRGCAVPETPGALPVACDLPAARFALECALFDLGAQAAGLPLARWLDPNASEAVALSALLRAETADGLAEEAVARVREGFGALKLKVGAATVREDARRVAAVRRAVGGRIALRLDANAALSPDRARALLDAVAPFGPEYVEEPLAGADPRALARLRRGSPVPLAADESASRVDAARALLAAAAVDVLVVKPLVLGGLLRARAVAEAAAEAGVGVVVTGALDGSVATWAGLHLAASLPEPRRPAGLATAHWLGDDAFPPPPIEKGRVELPPRPGLGLGAPG